ncbi:MAG: UDP-N-acetylmuramoyl-L-alanine--D-glutamate ligase, partial [Bacteroidetes bacterium]|nr:UDP-N-acetylmuramoyl-L-alanine--D-glutamate ligase [Bacteroidota bacterium]
MDYRGKKAVLFGLGTRTHVALARYLVRAGANVTITDRKPAEQLQTEIALLDGLPVHLVLGGHRYADILDADIIFVTPGASREQKVLQAAQALGIPLSSEIELLFELCPAPILAVTGSSGKTTTTTLAGMMLEEAGRKVFVGGNIGTPLVDRLEEIAPDAWVVLELSSFQLEHMAKSPHIGAILNVTPNHLDRHGTLERYGEAKLNLLRYQTADDYAVLGLDDAMAASYAPRCPGRLLAFRLSAPVDEGGYLDGERLVLRREGAEQVVCRACDVRMRGRHNLYNVLAAATLASAAGVGLDAIRRVATTFTGVEHRLEPVRELDSVRYYNDSIATAPERTLAALRSFAEPIVLIAGGMSKHLPVDELVRMVRQRVAGLVLMGELGEEIRRAMEMGDASASP